MKLVIGGKVLPFLMLLMLISIGIINPVSATITILYQSGNNDVVQLDSGRNVFDFGKDGGVDEVTDNDLAIPLDDGFDDGLAVDNSNSGLETVIFTWNPPGTLTIASPPDMATLVYNYDLDNGVTMTRTITITQDTTYAKVVDKYCNPTGSPKTFTVDYQINTGMNGDNEWFLPGHSASWFITPTGGLRTMPTANYLLARNINNPGNDPGDSHDFFVWETPMTQLYFEGGDEDDVYPVYDLSLSPGECVSLTFYLGMTNTDDESEAIAKALSGAAPVGGFLVPVNKLAVITPYLALAGLILAVSTVFVIRRRKD
jgi:hypothetical protein